jgi:putative DNA primase/helicase
VKQFNSEAKSMVLPVSDTPKINLRNGTLHFAPDGVELKSFDKQNGICYQLDYDYDPSATAPLFKKYFDQVQPDAVVRKLLCQYMGYIFLPKMNLEKVLFLQGGGDNGKSVFLNVIEALIGKEQCCEYSLEGLAKNEYQRAELGNYLFNKCTELSTRIGSSDTFKKIASREPLQARHPYGRPFNVRSYATSIFSMNNLPADVEQTRAFFRRFIIVPFEVTIPDDEKDIELAAKIISSEMSGVLNYVIKGMETLLETQKFDIPESVQNAVKNFQLESDSVLTYLADNGYRPDIEYCVSLQAMFNDYRQHCKDDEHRPVAKRTLAKRLRLLGYTVEKRGHDNQTVVFAKREYEQPDDCEVPI